MSRLWPLLLVGVATLLVHAPAKSGEFLWYDDLRFVVQNNHLDDLGNAGRFFTDLETTAAPQKATKDIYRPLRTLTFALLARKWGKDDAAPFHTTSILFHVATALALALVLRETGLGPWPVAAGALAFSLHPLTVETTAWVCSLGDAACGLFSVLAILAYARRRFVAALLLLVVALFWKEHAVVVPGIWLAWDFCFRREEAFAARPLLRGPAAGLALAVGFLVFRAVVVGAKTAQIAEPLGGSHAAAVLTMLAGLGWYAGTTLFPFSPTFDARVPIHESPYELSVFLGLAALAALVFAAVRGRGRVRFGVLWFLMALVPVSNLFVTLKIPTADRFLYLPLMGLAVLAAELVERTRPRSALVGGVTLVVLAALTVVRIGDWSSDAKLIEAGLRVNPKSRMLLWAEASHEAQRAIEALERNDGRTGILLATRAEQNYERYLKNSAQEEHIQVWLELGRLKRRVGFWAATNDPQQRERVALRDAFECYSTARKLQGLGKGRVVEAEVREAAERIRELGMLLVRPDEEKKLGQTIAITLEAIAFLEERYGRDGRFDRARLQLVDSIVTRVSHPAQAREGFMRVLATMNELDPENNRGSSYVRAQARFYLGLLAGMGKLNVEHLEAAHDLFMQAARELPETQAEALIGAARCHVFLVHFNKDESYRKDAERALERLERVRLTPKQRRVVDDLKLKMK